MQIIIVGASARAAAESAASAGVAVRAFDLFADEDLAAVANATRVPGQLYPRRLPELLDDVPHNIPWLYTGGIENQPELIDVISNRRQLLGNESAIVKLIRQPSWLAKVAARAGWYFPQTASGEFNVSERCSVVCKPRKHCGGFHTRIVEEAKLVDHDACLVQEFVPGPAYGGVFVGAALDQQNHFLGVTRQQTAADMAAHPLADQHPFAYVGSTGPVELADEDKCAWQALGGALAQAVPLVGLFGVDAIKHETRGWTLLELNPRWTASVELLERAYRFNAFRCHDAATNRGSLAEWLPSVERATLHYAKRIIYARSPVHIDDSWKDQLAGTLSAVHPADQGITSHDVPRVGTQIEALHPILTLIATGANVVALSDRLDGVAEGIYQATSAGSGNVRCD